MSSAALPALQVPGFPALNGVTPGSAGISAGVRLNLGATPARPDVTALRTLLASRPPVLQADITLSRDPRQFAVSVQLGGSLVIRGAGRSSLTLSDVSLVLKPQPVALTLHGSVSIPAGDTTFSATGYLTVGDTAVTAAFDLAAAGGNSLPSPFGLKGVHLSNIGAEIEVSAEPPAIAVGLLGRFTIGPTVPPATGPSVPSRTLAAMPPPDEFALILGLDGEIPNPVLLSMYLSDPSIEKAIEAVTDQPAQNLPEVFRSIRVLDLMLYWCDAPAGVQLPDGTWAYAGFGFNATLDIYGLRAHGALKINSSGVTGDACIDPLHVQGIIDLTGQGTGTPATYVGQATVKPGGPGDQDKHAGQPLSGARLAGGAVWHHGSDGQCRGHPVRLHLRDRQRRTRIFLGLSCTFRLPDRLASSFSVMLNLDLDLGVVNGVQLGQVHLANTGLSASLVASASPSVRSSSTARSRSTALAIRCRTVGQRAFQVALGHPAADLPAVQG